MAPIITAPAKLGQRKQPHATMKHFVICDSCKKCYASDVMSAIRYFNSSEIPKKDEVFQSLFL